MKVCFLSFALHMALQLGLLNSQNKSRSPSRQLKGLDHVMAPCGEVEADEPILAKSVPEEIRPGGGFEEQR